MEKPIDIKSCDVGGGLYEIGQAAFDYAEKNGLDIRAGERRIWSIGKHKVTGVILASITSEFYGNDLYECIWLR